MKKVLFLVAFLSLAGMSRIHALGEHQVDVNAPKDVKVTIEKTDEAFNQTTRDRVNANTDRVNANTDRVNTDIQDDDDDDDNE